MSEVRAPRPEVSTLASIASAEVGANPGRSGVRLLTDGTDAFAARVHSARGAERTLDVQTYIWRDDTTGRFIAHELMCAADRGVRVRVLLDDMDARPRDRALLALDQHAHISVRMFNPFRTRSGWLRTLAEISQRGERLNHRMHNKAWIVDGHIAIVGGRNIGDEYFAAAGEVNFIDLDVLLLGPAVDQAGREFERYWSSELSVPITRLRKYSRRRLLPRHLRRTLRRDVEQADLPAYAERLREGYGLVELLRPPLIWSADVRVVADDPRKALHDPQIEGSRVLESVAEEVRATACELLLVSPYFVPGLGGTAALRRLALQGAHVAVLTNSLAATDVAIVHSGYARYRTPLLEAGVKIYEMKSAPTVEDERRMRLGSSRASLHTKAAIIDGERIFVGSFNIDPRSAQLNCEMGVWIRSRRLAHVLAESFRFGADPLRSFPLSLTPRGELEWTERADGESIAYRREPHASWPRRLLASLLAQFPIESQL
jgi:cardiolipin synthase C